MSSLGDIIASKREESDDDGSFEDDFDTEVAPKVPTPQIPNRPTGSKTSSIESTPKVSDAVERSQSPIIPPRPKKQSLSASTISGEGDEHGEHDETVTDSLKHTIEKIPIVGGLLSGGKEHDDQGKIEEDEEAKDEVSPAPVIPKRPQRTEATKVEEPPKPFIPSRPKKSIQSSDGESESSVSPVIPSRLKKHVSIDDHEQVKLGSSDALKIEETKSHVEKEEASNSPVIPSRPTKKIGPSNEDKIGDKLEETNDEPELTIDNEGGIAETQLKADVEKPFKASEIPEFKNSDKLEVETNETPIKLENDIFDAKSEPSDLPKSITTDQDALDFANEQRSSISSSNSKDITTEAQAIDRIEESTSDLSSIQKFSSNDSLTIPIIPKHPSRPSKKSNEELREAEINPDAKADNDESLLDKTEKAEESVKIEDEFKPNPIIPSRPIKKSTEEKKNDITSVLESKEDLSEKEVKSEEKIADKFKLDNPLGIDEEQPSEQQGKVEPESKPSPIIPSRPAKKSSDSKSSELLDQTKPKIAVKAPPPVPKKPSSKIAAFQEMLRKNQEQERSRDVGPSDRSSSPTKRPSFNKTDSSDNSSEKFKFKQNLNGIFALPGMTAPGASIPKNLQEDEKEKEGEIEDDSKEVKDVRRSRAKGPRGKRTTKVEKVEIPDHRVIKVVDIWSSGLNSSGFQYDNKKEVKEALVVDEDNKAFDKELDDKSDKDYINISNPVEELTRESTVNTFEDSSSIPQEETIKIPESIPGDNTKEDKGYESDNNDTAEEQSFQSIKPLKSRPDFENVASIRSLKSLGSEEEHETDEIEAEAVENLTDSNETEAHSLKPLKSKPEYGNDASIKSLKSVDVDYTSVTQDDIKDDIKDDVDEFSFENNDIKEQDEFVDAANE